MWQKYASTSVNGFIKYLISCFLLLIYDFWSQRQEPCEYWLRKMSDEQKLISLVHVEVCDSLTALSVENWLSPSPSDTTPSQQPAPPPCALGRNRTWMRLGAGWDQVGRKGRVASGQGRRVWALPLRLPVCDRKAPGRIIECHPASTATDQQHFIYWLAFFANCKSFFFVVFFKWQSRNVACTVGHELQVVDSLVLLLVSFGFEMQWNTSDFLQWIYSEWMYYLRPQKNRGQTEDVI